MGLSDMKILTVASQKGGVGKTTLTAHLGVAALADGCKAAILDTDPQASLAEWWNSRNSHDLPFLQSSLSTLGENINAAREAGIEYLIIDTPPSVTETICQIVSLSDMVLIPTKASILDTRAVAKTFHAVYSLGVPLTFVISIAKKKARLTLETAQTLSQFGTLAYSIIGDRVDVPTSMALGSTVIEQDESSKSSQEFMDLWKYLRGEMDRRVRK